MLRMRGGREGSRWPTRPLSFQAAVKIASLRCRCGELEAKERLRGQQPGTSWRWTSARQDLLGCVSQEWWNCPRSSDYLWYMIWGKEMGVAHGQVSWTYSLPLALPIWTVSTTEVGGLTTCLLVKEGLGQDAQLICSCGRSFPFWLAAME